MLPLSDTQVQDKLCHHNLGGELQAAHKHRSCNTGCFLLVFDTRIAFCCIEKTLYSSAAMIELSPGKGPLPSTPWPLPRSLRFHRLIHVLKKYLHAGTHSEPCKEANMQHHMPKVKCSQIAATFSAVSFDTRCERDAHQVRMSEAFLTAVRNMELCQSF